MLHGYSIDSLIAARRGRNKQEGSLSSDTMRLVTTSVGTLRVLDTGGYKHPTIIVPDGPCVIEHYAKLITLLSSSFRVVCFDLPGFGFSYPAFGYNFTIVQTSEAIIELMDALNMRNAALAFTCANGFFALHIAKHHPHRVSHVILGQTPSFQSMCEWDNRIIPKILHVPYIGQLVVAGFARRFSSNWYNLALPPGSENQPHFVEIADYAIQSGGCFCLASFVQGLRKTQAVELSNIPIPTLLIHGDADRSHKRTDFASLRSHVPAAEIIAFKGCGHFPDLERPEEYVMQITRFITTV